MTGADEWSTNTLGFACQVIRLNENTASKREEATHSCPRFLLSLRPDGGYWSDPFLSGVASNEPSPKFETR
jgi:hypothetical protein